MAANQTSLQDEKQKKDFNSLEHQRFIQTLLQTSPWLKNDKDWREKLDALMGKPDPNPTLTQPWFQETLKALKANTCSSLDLRNKKIDDKATQVLAEYLAHNSSLIYLDLSGNPLDVLGAEYIARALKSNKHLLSLNLADTGIGSPGLISISEALTTNQTLRTLDLTRNAINCSGTSALSQALLKNKTLHSLILKGNLLKYAAPLLKIKTLSNLDISDYSCIVDIDFFCFELKFHPNLKSLNLENVNLTDLAITYLGAFLQSTRTLTSLRLGKTQASIPPLKASPPLFEALKSNTSLIELFLSGYEIDIKSELEFIESFKKNKHMLHLSFNNYNTPPNDPPKIKQPSKTTCLLQDMLIQAQGFERRFNNWMNINISSHNSSSSSSSHHSHINGNNALSQLNEFNQDFQRFLSFSKKNFKQLIEKNRETEVIPFREIDIIQQKFLKVTANLSYRMAHFKQELFKPKPPETGKFKPGSKK